MQDTHYNVVVAGAGIGGICAAVGAARTGGSVLLIERMPQIGGTGVHSPVALIVKFRDANLRPINDGLHREFFPHAYADTDEHHYDETDLKRRYDAALAGEASLTVFTGTAVESVQTTGRRIDAVTLVGVHASRVTGDVFVDSTADGNLSAMAGATYEMGRDGDGALQPATLTFKVVDFDLNQMPPAGPNMFHRIANVVNPLMKRMKAAGGTSNLRNDVLPFIYPDHKGILFNATRVAQVDPTDPASLERGYAEGLKQVHELFDCMKQHPAFAHARIAFISDKLGVREGRRVMGDYVLTDADCMSEARFDDMVAACAAPVDVHNPANHSSRYDHIPGSGYYHIPYRCLIARDFDNLLLGSRCISGTHEAHGSYRVMCSLSAIGQAAGVAAALCAQAKAGDVRAVEARAIRGELAAQGQFVEGETTPR